MMGSRKTALAVYAVLIALLIALDQATKLFIDANIEYLARIPVVDGFFNIVNVRNYGASFSMLSNAGGWQVWMFSAIAVAVCAFLGYLMVRTWQHTAQCVSYVFLFAGAVGNLIDRISYGYVIDFLDFYIGTLHWPAFNVADICICLGAALIVVIEFFFHPAKTDK